MKKQKPVYLVWQDGEDLEFWNQYESLNDAVSSEEEPVEVYRAQPRLVGKFKKAAKLIRVKERSKKMAKTKKKTAKRKTCK